MLRDLYTTHPKSETLMVFNAGFYIFAILFVAPRDYSEEHFANFAKTEAWLRQIGGNITLDGFASSSECLYISDCLPSLAFSSFPPILTLRDFNIDSKSVSWDAHNTQPFRRLFYLLLPLSLLQESFTTSTTQTHRLYPTDHPFAHTSSFRDGCIIQDPRQHTKGWADLRLDEGITEPRQA